MQQVFAIRHLSSLIFLWSPRGVTESWRLLAPSSAALHIIVSVQILTKMVFVLDGNYATVFQFYTVASALIDFTHYRNESGCKKKSIQ